MEEWDILDDLKTEKTLALSMTPIQSLDIYGDITEDIEENNGHETPESDPDVDITSTLQICHEEMMKPKYRYEYTYSVDHYITEHVASKVSIGSFLGNFPINTSMETDIDREIFQLNSNYIKKHIWTPLFFVTCLLIKSLENSSVELGPLVGPF